MLLGGQCERILPKTKSIADSNQTHELLGALAVHRPQAETSQDLHCPPRYHPEAYRTLVPFLGAWAFPGEGVFGGFVGPFAG